ncbi:hypothetical protein [Candidatus Liberibacter africanus]|uniref:hypothetical protein n=1 Tax=Liberibacter africanus TaxID=34020 RepID=UPI001AE68515|nr:hypothetical protein [Candidatus Liberibacter africanus]
MLFLGLRRSDVIRIGKENVKDNVLSISKQKTVHVPIFESLQKCLDVVGEEHDTFLINTRGKTFSSQILSAMVWRRCKKRDYLII